jgi:hypothetical protein
VQTGIRLKNRSGFTRKSGPKPNAGTRLRRNSSQENKKINISSTERTIYTFARNLNGLTAICWTGFRACHSTVQRKAVFAWRPYLSNIVTGRQACAAVRRPKAKTPKLALILQGSSGCRDKFGHDGAACTSFVNLFSFPGAGSAKPVFSGSLAGTGGINPFPDRLLALRVGYGLHPEGPGLTWSRN